MHPRRPRAVPLTIFVGSLTVALSIALLVGWTLLIVRYWPVHGPMAGGVWLLVAGILSLAVIMTVLVLFSVLLVREIASNRRQTSFIDSVTHELKSPLASIKLCLETLRRPDLSPEQQAALREMMLEDVERLSTFIDDVLEASRLPQARAPTRTAEVELAALVHACAERVLQRYRAPADAIDVRVPPDLRLLTDPTAPEAVLKNLLDNAVKYSERPEGIKVIAIREPRDQIVIEVRDRGVGIPGRELKRIFERFYRVSDESVRARRGTGLGLYVVRSLVRTMGGRIEARSAGPGQGTVMRVRLPQGRLRRATGAAGATSMERR